MSTVELMEEIVLYVRRLYVLSPVDAYNSAAWHGEIVLDEL